MPQFAYRAADRQGALLSGQRFARGEDDLYALLQKAGLSLVTCRIKGEAPRRILPLADQVLICRHLLALVQAGVPAHLALGDLAESAVGKAQAIILREIQASVLDGASFSDAFAEQGVRFDALFVLLLRAGEKTGRLAEALSYLHESLGWKERAAARLKRSVAYPLVQVALATLATLVLMLVAVPQITQLMESLGQDLPLYSKILLGGVRVMGFGLAGILLGAGALALMLPLLRARKSLAVAVDGFCLRLPGLSMLLLKLDLARLAQLLAAMLKSGVSMSEALRVLPGFAGNKALARDLEKLRAAVDDGAGISESFRRNLRLPPLMLRLLQIGEDSGELSGSLLYIARLYQEEGEARLEAVLKGLSVAVTLAVGFVLASIVVGVLYPLYQGLGGVMG